MWRFHLRCLWVIGSLHGEDQLSGRQLAARVRSGAGALRRGVVCRCGSAACGASGRGRDSLSLARAVQEHCSSSRACSCEIPSEPGLQSFNVINPRVVRKNHIFTQGHPGLLWNATSSTQPDLNMFCYFVISMFVD